MLHMQEEPEVNGNVSIIKRQADGYNGMMTNQTLLPASPKIEKSAARIRNSGWATETMH